MIYKGKRYKERLADLQNEHSRILHDCVKIAQEFAKDHNFQIDPTPEFFKNRPEVKLEFLTADKFYEKDAKSVYEKPNNFLETQGKDAVKNALNLTETLSLFKEQIELHLKVQEKTLEVLSKMEEKMSERTENLSIPKPSFWQRIKTFIRRLKPI